MTDSFKKLKNRSLLGAVIKSLISGISTGLGVVGIILLALKLNAIEINFLYYILIGLGATVLCGALVFLFIRPTDKKLAKKLDKEFALNEKVQTMVAYNDKSGDIVEIQREDTSEKLSNIRGFKVKFSRIWQYIVIAVVGLALFFTAIFVPGVKTDPDGDNTDNEPPVDNPIQTDNAFEYDLYMQAALAELITNIRSSSLSQENKDAIIAVLQDLDDKLQLVEWESEMKSVVIAAVGKIDAIIEETNTFIELSTELAKYDAEVAASLIYGVTVYKSSGVTLSDYSRVQGLESILGDSIEGNISFRLESSRDALKVEQEKGLATVLGEYTANLSTALGNSNVDDTDELYISVNTFRRALVTTFGKVDRGYSDNLLWGEIDTAYTEFLNNLVKSLSVQSYNCIMDEFIRYKLAEIFGLSLSELPTLIIDTLYVEEGGGESGGSGDSDGESSSGGYGSGEEIYGSDDLIYDPDTGELVKYSEVIDKYYEIFLEWSMQGLLPEDVAQYINDYFDLLYSGIPESDSGDN